MQHITCQSVRGGHLLVREQEAHQLGEINKMLRPKSHRATTEIYLISNILVVRHRFKMPRLRMYWNFLSIYHVVIVGGFAGRHGSRTNARVLFVGLS